LDEKSAEFVEPERAVDVVWWVGENEGCVMVDWDSGIGGGRFGVVMVEGFEVFLKLER